MRILTHTVAAALLSILPFAATAPVAAAAAAKKPHAAAQKKVDREKEKNEASDQVLRDAITQLQAIKDRVHGAAKIYGGHRGKADEHIDAAIRELQAALKFDETHEKK